MSGRVLRPKTKLVIRDDVVVGAVGAEFVKD